MPNFIVDTVYSGLKVYIDLRSLRDRILCAQNIVALTNQDPLPGPWVDMDRDYLILGSKIRGEAYLLIKNDI